MRGREFLMKDAYSFDLSAEAARHSYNRMFVAYLRTFARMGLKSIPMAADTGPIGGDLSHEFIILADTGESQVFCHADLVETPVPPADVDFGSDLTRYIAPWTRHYAATDDKHDEKRFAAEVPQDKRVSARGVEIGHIFFFGTKYSDPMGCRVQGPDGSMVTVQMGSYGIGVSRLPAAIIEASHDEAGIVWPVPVAPFEVGLVNLKPGDKATDAACESLYGQLQEAGVSVLYDDTQERPGGKFATMDLIGLPFQLIVGPKGLKGGEVEVKERKSGARATASPEAAVKRLVGEVARAAHPGVTGLDWPDLPQRRAATCNDGGFCAAMTAPAVDTRPFAPFEWLLAMRYLRARRKEGFISVIAGFSFAGILLGVATLIIVMAVMNGFRKELFAKILGLDGHVIVIRVDYRRLPRLRRVRQEAGGGAHGQACRAADREPGDRLHGGAWRSAPRCAASAARGCRRCR